MRKLAMIAILIPAIASCAPSAYAEDASVLLNRYGNPVLHTEEEEERLRQLERHYEEKVRDINGRTMFDTAQSIELSYARNRIAEADKQLYELSDRLIELKLAMDEHMDADIETIMRLDAEYRTTATLLREGRERRNELTGGAREASRDPNLISDQRKLAKLQQDIERQRDRVNEASAYAELGDIAYFRSPLSIPVRITSPYGERLDPVTRDEMTFHSGIDLEAPEGTPVLAAFNGRIAETGESESLGLYVWVEHGNGIRTLYGHLSSVSAAEGQEVRQYDEIARSGNTGTRTTGEHLHFGIAINGNSVNPAVIVHESN